MDPSRLQTASLQKHPSGAAITRVMAAALEAVDPYRAVSAHLELCDEQLRIARQVYDLSHFRRIILVGAGKAAYPMAHAALDILGTRISSGLLITKDGHAPTLEPARNIHLREAGHPLPDARGEAAALEMAALLENAASDDLILCLISGGGSALMPAPASPSDPRRSPADHLRSPCLRRRHHPD